MPPEQPVPIDLVVLDMAGTTIVDDGLVERAFIAALDETGFADGPDERVRAIELVRASAGQPRIEVFTELLGSTSHAAITNRAFEEAYDRFATDGLIAPIPGAREAIRDLRDAGVAVALATGFASYTQQSILETLGWEDAADIALSPADARGRGRPHPDLNLVALMTLRTASVRSMAVVGDAVSDMQSGVRAGAGMIVGVLSGAHDESRLRAAGATHVLRDITGLPALVGAVVPVGA